MADTGLMDVKKQLQKEEEEYIERSKNLPVSNIPSLMGVLYDYGMGYLERNPLTLRKSYSEPFTSKSQVMGYNLQNATQQLKSSISFLDLVDAFKEATNPPFKTLVPDEKSRGE